MVIPSTRMRDAGTSGSILTRPRRRPSGSHILIAVAAVLAFALNVIALQDRSATTLVAVAKHPISIGDSVDAQDVRFVSIPARFEALGSLVSQEELGEGSVAARHLGEGELIVSSALAKEAAKSGLRTMSVPVAPAHASGGRISLGDRVDVISVLDGQPEFVAVDLEVVGTAEAARTGLAGFGDYFVVVALDDREALILAAALERGSIEIVRSTGAAPVAKDGR